MKVLALSGSLRQDAFSTRLVNAAADLAPEGVRVVLDMQGLFALDTTGLDALQDVFKAVRLRGGTLELHAPQAVVASLLQRSGFADELVLRCGDASIVLVWSADGELEYAITSLRDVHEQVLVEQELRTSLERFNLLVENSHDVLYQFDQNGMLAWITPNVTALTGNASPILLDARGERVGKIVKPEPAAVPPADRPRLTLKFLSTGDERLQAAIDKATAKGRTQLVTVLQNRLDVRTQLLGLLQDKQANVAEVKQICIDHGINV